MGLCLIKDLEQATVKSMLDARETDGPFNSLDDFVKRVTISLEQIRILIRIRAFRFTGRTSKELLWDAYAIMSKTKKTIPRKELFALPPEPTSLPPLEYEKFEDASNEMQILGFPHTSPFSLLAKKYKGITPAKNLMEHLGKEIYMIGYYANIRKVTTITGEIMYFGCFTDEAGDMFDTLHFPQSINRYPFTGKGCYLLKGTVIEDFEVPGVEVNRMERIDWGFGV
jgi:DNA polymerase-3 subunit alpha